MKYYKQNNEVYAYELDGSQDHLIGDKVLMAAEEVEAHINPPKTAEELAWEAKNLRSANMLTGFNYKGTQISVTKEDGDGLMQVKSAFELGLTETVMHFKNGSKLQITATEFPEFALAFATERAKYFV